LQLINDDGNLVDAFFLAAVLALKNTRLPEVTMKGDEILVSNNKQHLIYLKGKAEWPLGIFWIALLEKA
jgi:exosome complex RNA-binding protein Rrp42 (RNase PH superfamily)